MADLKTSKTILFDGHCNLCNGFVQFVIKRDPKAQFRFAPLTSKFGREWVNPSDQQQDSIVLIEDGQVYTKSTAALRIATRLTGIYPLLGTLWLVPRFIRDWVYDRIARNRYRWFGKRESCMVPTEELRNRFIED